MPTIKFRPAAISRRSFVEKVGFGAAGAILSPIAQSLVQEAHGQANTRKRFLAFIPGCGLHYTWMFSPTEFGGGNVNNPVMGSTSYTLPPFLQPLNKYRSRLLLVDGLGNRVPNMGPIGNHTIGYGSLACRPSPGSATADFGPPGGITIDQYIANGISNDRYHRSVLVGQTNHIPAGNLPVLATVFASAANRPEVHFENTTSLFTHLFGDLVADQAGVRRLAYKKRILLDRMRRDVSRLQAALAGPERRKLDDYMSAISDVETRLNVSMGLSCNQAASPTVGPTYEDKLSAMMDMATLAITCNLTNVVGVCAGAGNSHVTFPSTWTKIGVTLDQHGDANTLGRPMTPIHQFLTGLVAKAYDTLAAVPEGNGNVADSLITLYTSDNGEDHHSEKHRWPVVVVGDAGAGRKLNTGGRFFRFPPGSGAAGKRALADLYSTLANACGVPNDGFAKDSPVLPKPQGPISDFLA